MMKSLSSRRDFPFNVRTHENSAQAAVASLGDELFVEPLGAGSGGISWGTAVWSLDEKSWIHQ